MAQVRSWAGLDVHARSVLAVSMDATTGEIRSQRLPGETVKVVEFCRSLPGPTRVAYEAGPTGYGLARALHVAGVGCVVAAGDTLVPVVNRRERLSRAALYLVCDVQPDAFLHAALRGGVDIVQLRVKGAGDVLGAAKRYREITAAHDALLIVNDHPELAVAADADGVHVGQDDVPVADAREIVGPERVIGLSTHTPAQIDEARGVDYIGVGPVHATPTKPDRPAVGLELVRYAARHARVPFFAIGGIDADNVALVRDAGATRIAVVRALTGADDPEAVAAALKGVRVGAA